MSFPKAKKFFIYLLAGFIILSVIAAGFPGKLFATEIGKEAKELIEMIDEEIIFPAEQDKPSSLGKGPSEGNKVFMKHVVRGDKGTGSLSQFV